jgi:hypothetical protein
MVSFSASGPSRQLVPCIDMSGVGRKPDLLLTISIRSPQKPPFMSDPFRASEWASSVRFIRQHRRRTAA